MKGRLTIHNAQGEIDGLKTSMNPHLRGIAWLVCLVLVLVLVILGLKPGRMAILQAKGMRGLLQAGASLSSEDLANPFICLRGVGNTIQAQTALLNVSDMYLRGVGLCLAGERDAGLVALKDAGGNSNAEEQYSAGLSMGKSQTGVDSLLESKLDEDMLIAVLQELSMQPDIDPYPALRILAHQANKQRSTWSLWLQASSRLETAKEWQVAIDWLNDGLVIAPTEVRSSLFLRIGRIYQTQTEPQDIQEALESYNLAIDTGGWLTPSDEAYAHIYRGEIYRSLKDKFSSEQALGEFQTALKIQTGSYWALLNIGFVYLYDFKDIDLAETYFHQAIAGNPQSPYAYYYLGEVYRAQGDNETAINWYRQALEHQPDWQPALDRLNTLTGAATEGK